MKQCRFIAKSTGLQCKNKAISGSLCLIHYPKKAGLIIGAILTILGVFLGVLFDEPIRIHLPKLSWFYFLDNERPKIERINPDIISKKSIPKETEFFSISVSDQSSGLNLERSNIKILYKDNINFQMIGCNTEKSDLNFCIKPKKPFKYGEYRLRLALMDNAGNLLERSLQFVVREKEDIKITVTGKKFIDSKMKKLFNPFFQKYRTIANDFKFSTLSIYLKNNMAKAILRDLYLTINAPKSIFSLEQIGCVEAKGYNSYVLAEGFDQRLRGHIFASERYLDIEEIAPHGFLRFVALIGEPKTTKKLHLEARYHDEIRAFGHYICEGYGSTEMRRLHKSYTIKWQ